MATDPVCGMQVDESTALTAQRGDEKFYFCSEHCRDNFLDYALAEKSSNCKHHSNIPARVGQKVQRSGFKDSMLV